VWLFVAGASAGYCLLILAFGALRPTVSQPVGIVGLGLLDVTAVVVVPLVALGSWWIPNADLAYLVTGLAVHLTYIPLVAGTMVLLSQGTAAFGHEPMTCPSGLDRKNVPDQPLSATTDLSPGGGVSGHW